MIKTKGKKRKVGRPKKRGPKKKRKYISKKPKIDGRTLVSHRKYYNYKIISCHNGKQVDTIGKYETIKEAYSMLSKLEESNSNVVFRRLFCIGDEIYDSVDEYLLLEENLSKTKKNQMVRNRFGRFTEISLNTDKWVVIDSKPRIVEETFYVFGYNARTDRKTFSWIYENLILGDIHSRFDIKRIIQYKNKIVIKNDDSTFDIVFCKNASDAIRFYNLLSETVKKEKRKQIYFIGSYSEISDKRRKLEEDLIAYTGFTKKKIQMDSCDFYKKIKES